MSDTTQTLNKRNIGQLFDRIADRYDLLNHILSLNIDRYWRKRAAKAIKTEEGELLDVAIGTADLAIAIAKQHQQLNILGIDLSNEMMRLGRQKVAQLNLSHRIGFQQCNALEMPFQDETYDVITCAYGVRNFSDLQKGLKEFYRVLKPGGELVILEFSYPTNRLIAWAYDLYFSKIMPSIGRLVSQDKTAYTYLNRSVKTFVWGKQMCDCIRSAGFSKVNYKPITFGITTLYTTIK